MNADKRIPRLLLRLRLNLFLVMFLRAMDEFLSPGHTAHVYTDF